MVFMTNSYWLWIKSAVLVYPGGISTAQPILYIYSTVLAYLTKPRRAQTHCIWRHFCNLTSYNCKAYTMFSQGQISRYFEHISFENARHASGSLQYLQELQKRHLAKVPFESLSLHYSRHRLLSLDPQDLFQKIVVRGMGGYCMENNGFFGVVLRTLGFTIFNAGGRVSDATGGRPGPGYMGLYVFSPFTFWKSSTCAGRTLIKIVLHVCVCFIHCGFFVQ